MNNKGEKTRYSDEELEEFKVLIENKLIKAKEQLDFYLKQMEEMGQNNNTKIKGLDELLEAKLDDYKDEQKEKAKDKLKNKLKDLF